MTQRIIMLLGLSFCLENYTANAEEEDHSDNATLLELHGLEPFPNIFVKLPGQIEEGEENVVSIEVIREREEEVILRYSNEFSESSRNVFSGFFQRIFPGLSGKYSEDYPGKYSQDYPDSGNRPAVQSTLSYAQAEAQYPRASRSPHIEWNDPDFLNILYKKEDHLYEWDEKRRSSWIRKVADHLQKDICLDIGLARGCLDTFQVGTLADARFAVIFVHGAIDDKKHLGVNDIGFGGNFNFLKNLVIRNNGVYFSPSFRLVSREIAVMKKLISHIRSQAPGAKIAFACGSSGMVICSGIAESRDDMAVDGLIFLGGSGAPRLDENLPFYANRTPIIIANASYDGWESKKRFYDRVKEMDSQYPVQFQLYHGGVHGTPIRMINWQRSLNYLFSNSMER
ncbi:MAG: hypothetical protein OXB84_01810 [Halobacteriovoraceae bacterium]|nr:hypothetical protein [Halobacteriovoraceae bacterium]